MVGNGIGIPNCAMKNGLGQVYHRTVNITSSSLPHLRAHRNQKSVGGSSNAARFILSLRGMALQNVHLQLHFCINVPFLFHLKLEQILKDPNSIDTAILEARIINATTMVSSFAVSCD